jgi:hypothetical protein
MITTNFVLSARVRSQGHPSMNFVTVRHIYSCALQLRRSMCFANYIIKAQRPRSIIITVINNKNKHKLVRVSTAQSFTSWQPLSWTTRTLPVMQSECVHGIPPLVPILNEIIQPIISHKYNISGTHLSTTLPSTPVSPTCWKAGHNIKRKKETEKK